jgi:GT2 family glycosyltransferase
MWTLEKVVPDAGRKNQWLVSNNSSDGTQEYLNTLDNRKIIIKNLNRNTGSAGGYNAGFNAALEGTDSDWIVTFDDDAYPQEGAINKFRQLEISDEISAISAAVFQNLLVEIFE